jgi:DNA primase
VKRFQLGYASAAWDDLLNYLKRKNVPLSLMEKAGLIIPRNKGDGFYDRFRDRVMFPIFDTRGHCRAFGGRIIEGDGVKYINSPETLLYTKGIICSVFIWPNKRS